MNKFLIALLIGLAIYSPAFAQLKGVISATYWTLSLEEAPAEAPAFAQVERVNPVLGYKTPDFAQLEGIIPEEVSPIQAQRIINEEFLTEEVVKTTAPLKRHVDYIAKNYEERPLREMIKNAEEIERKVARKLDDEYVPYDRRIDVKKPEQVKRFFRKRINVIY